jgi:hypothetical protein
MVFLRLFPALAPRIVVLTTLSLCASACPPDVVNPRADGGSSGGGGGGGGTFCKGRVPTKLHVRYYRKAHMSYEPYGEAWVKVANQTTTYKILDVTYSSGSTGDTGKSFRTTLTQEVRGATITHRSFDQDLEYGGEYDGCFVNTFPQSTVPGQIISLASMGGVVLWEAVDGRYVRPDEVTAEGFTCHVWNANPKCTNQRLCLDIFDGEINDPSFQVFEIDESDFPDSVLDGPTCPDTQAACKANDPDAYFGTSEAGHSCQYRGEAASWGLDTAGFLQRYQAAKATYGLR